MERKWWTLIAVSVAIFMLLLDITVVNVALPDIQRSLHSSFSDLQWVVNAYALTLAAFLLTSGSVADLIGRRRVFVVGLFVFTIASAVCGLSTTPLMLNLARAVQGTGGAMMFATSLALLAQAFHGKERGTAFGVFGAVTGAAVAIGPVLGGVITSSIGWEWIFFVNVPIGVIAVFITLTRVADSRDPNATGVDWPGLVTFSGSLFLLVYALVQGNERGWGSTEIVSFLIGAAVLMALFVVVEHRQTQPMLDLSLFRRPAFSGASIVAFTLSGSFFAMFLYLTLYIQDVLGYTPLQAGLRFLPSTLLSFIVAPIAGRLSVRMPVRLLLGSGLVADRDRPADDDDHRRRLQLDRADSRLPAGRHGRGVGQPATGLHRRRGGARRAQRDGLGDQLDLPSGRHRHGDRRTGRRVPAQRDPRHNGRARRERTSARDPEHRPRPPRHDAGVRRSHRVSRSHSPRPRARPWITPIAWGSPERSRRLP